MTTPYVLADFNPGDGDRIELLFNSGATDPVFSFSDGQLLVSFRGWGQQHDDLVVATIDGDLSEGEVLGAVSIGNSLGFTQSWETYVYADDTNTVAGTLYGTTGNDYIYTNATTIDNVIHTLGGDDTVYGGEGYDVVVMEGSAGSLSYISDDGGAQLVVTTDSARVSATGVEEFRIDGKVYSRVGDDLVVSTAAPVLTDPGLVIELADGLEDVPYQVSVTDLVSGYSDPEGTELSVSNLTASAGTVTDNGDGTYTINPAPNFTGAVALNYDVVDSDGGAVAAARTFYLAAVNDVPVSVDDVLTVSEDSSPVLVDVLANDSDVDQDNLTVSSVETTGSGVVSTDGSQISYEPAPNFHGTETISYTVDDGNGGTDTATLMVNVSSVNDVPVAVSDVLGVSEDASSVLIDVLANDTDEDNDALTVSAPVSDNGGTVSVVGNQISYQPAADFHGTETITYTLTDGNGGTDTGTVTVTVSSVNDAPTGQASAVLAGGTEDQAYVVSATDLLQGFSDVDGDSLLVSNLVSSSGSVTDNLDGTFTINPALNDNGWVSLNYDVRDASGGSVAANQNFILEAVNDLPTGVVTAVIVNGTEDQTYVVSATDLLQGFSDVDGDSLSVSNLVSSSGSVTDNGDGTYTINPAPNFNGFVTLSFEAVDGQGGAVAAARIFYVEAVNDAPVSVDDVLMVSEDSSSVLVDVLANDSDVDQDDLTVSTIETTGTGVVSSDGSQITMSLRRTSMALRRLATPLMMVTVVLRLQP